MHAGQNVSAVLVCEYTISFQDRVETTTDNEVSVKTVFRGRRRQWENLRGQTGSLLRCDGKTRGRTGPREEHDHSFSFTMTELHDDDRPREIRTQETAKYELSILKIASGVLKTRA